MKSFVHRGVIALLATAGVVWSAAAAASDNAPVIVVPGRSDVPVMIDGRDASWGVVEGDWGLYRPGWLPPTVIKPPCCETYMGRPVRHYFPGTGHAPGYGRREFDPPRARRIKPAESYSRSWTAESENLPSTIMPPSYDVPPVMIAPYFGGPGPRPGPGPGPRPGPLR
jgi:hypothetical protein